VWVTWNNVSEVVMKHDEFFRKHPVFAGADMAGYLSSQGEVGGRAQETLLAYHRRTGRLVRIRRGLYAVVPPGSDPDSFPIDPFLVASKLTEDAVLSYHTALEFYGRAYSIHDHFVYSASRPLGSTRFRSHIFRGTRSPEALRRAGEARFGVLTEERAGMNLRVTSLERTLVDVLDRPWLSGGWEEIWRSLESVEFFDLDKVVEYALLLKNATTVAKVGFLLEQHRELWMVEDSHLMKLHDLRPRQPRYLDRSKRETGRLVEDWNLVVPVAVLERSWGEVL
jgi:predicted transcriptional regulator of viral defense system